MNRALGITTALLLSALSLVAQQATPAPAPQKIDALEHRIDDLTNTLDQTLLELQHLRTELNALRQQSTVSDLIKGNATLLEPTATPSTAQLDDIHEQLDLFAAEIKQHDQIKVETASKYPLRVAGIALFNAYNNSGVVDNSELPTFALTRFPNASHGSGGATLRQTILSLEATGPTLSGAQTSASLSIDFFGGTTSNTQGYAASAGYVRLRTGDLTLDWHNTTLQVGYTEPLITPRSPTSYATVAHPAFSAAGNLWAWVPQLRVEQRIPLGSTKGLIAFEGGLLYPYAYNYTNTQLNSPVSATRRPGVEGRISYRADNTSSRALVFGVSGYTARQFYSGGFHITSWAITGDYQIPLTRWFDLSGEAYRGTAIGGLGGGGYNDVLFANNYLSSTVVVRAVETAGGWTQLKAHLNRRLEANIMYGIDDSFKRNLDDVTLPSGTSSLSTIGRNQNFGGNLIFHPRSNILLSPEYRHIETWYYFGTPNVASIFTLSAGYQF